MGISGALTLMMVFGGIALLISLFARTFDDDRVRRYIEENGGQLLQKTWEPFGAGWRGEKDARIYRIVYRDAHGNTREATCKTSLFSGVYFTNDNIVAPATQADPEPARYQPETNQANAAELKRLRDENARLQAELARARQPQPLFNEASAAKGEKSARHLQ